MASFFRDVLIGVPLGSSNSSEWIKFVDNPEVIKVKEDARMVPQLVDEELKSRWIAYVRENFKVIRMSSAQAARLGQLKNDEIQEASRATGDSPAIAAKLRREAALLPLASIEAQSSSVLLKSGTEVSIRLQAGVIVFKSFSFFVNVATDASSGYLELCRAPYNTEPLLESISEPSDGAVRRYEASDADRARVREARPHQLPRLDTPTIIGVGDVPDLNRDELVLSRLDETVDYQENSTNRGWRLIYRGNVDPQEPLLWHGAEFTLKGSRRRVEGQKKIFVRLASLQGNLSIGLTECDDPSCVCRRKYPGAKQGKKSCRKSVGFNSDGVKWNRGKPVQMKAYQICQGDLLALILVSAGSDKFARVEIGVSQNQSSMTILPVKLESDSPGGGRLVIRASGSATIDLLLGDGPSRTLGQGVPLWQALPAVKEEPESEADCDMPDA
ncbi:hypothetical protein Pmar_PMAR004033 [Perkinsus marinus ATCC 50983]|uniref:Uncharacterized protein n=1 Tax=Perkinsus marinus (strain ATCC 50983 / TXsc) TaxID=423536 RepID=C5M0J2_PERM5|nr:hypothetical protein Pmar_PMAR004033 [Perkinsus marinus ATCC 50983]EEQ97527.1 hypothetical protein Pmar_PMAR004033 [Perkinsus marinus ATCC 50983]|eukprot:XP_002764810.1 hypothetical protein Pmar_PMAR004033 [Perkinsus marinus ATCC 50983]